MRIRTFIYNNSIINPTKYNTIWHPIYGIYFKCAIINDILHGDEIYYYENGQISYLVYRVNDKIHGDKIYYDETGSIHRFKQQFNDYKIVKEYYKSGIMKNESIWINDIKKLEINYY